MSLFKAPRDQLVCISFATFTKSAWVLAIFAATLSTYLPLDPDPESDCVYYSLYTDWTSD